MSARRLARLVLLCALSLRNVACAQAEQGPPQPPPPETVIVPLPRAAPMAFLIGAYPSRAYPGLEQASNHLEAWLARDGHRDAVRAQPIKLHLFAYTPHEVGGGDDSPFHWHPHRIATDGTHWTESIGYDQRGFADVNDAAPPCVAIYAPAERRAAPPSPAAFLVDAVPMLRSPTPLDHRQLEKLWLERTGPRVILRWQVREAAFATQLQPITKHNLLYTCEGLALTRTLRVGTPPPDSVANAVKQLSPLIDSGIQQPHPLLAARAAGMHNAVTQQHKRHPILDALRKVTSGDERALVCLGELGEHPDLLVRRAAADELSRHQATAELWCMGLVRAFAREREPQVLSRMLTTAMELGPRAKLFLEPVRTLTTHQDLGLARAAQAALAQLEK